MTPHPFESPYVSSYIDLIDRFIGRDISAAGFEKSFVQAMKSERRILGDPVYPILQELFEDADAYAERAAPRTGGGFSMLNNCLRAQFGPGMRGEHSDMSEAGAHLQNSSAAAQTRRGRAVWNLGGG